MQLTVTIDTEEDNWFGFEGGEYTTQNAGRLAPLQRLFDEFGAKPTYLLTYVMAGDPAAAGFLREVHERGRCEIGAHCHPWNTPPFGESRTTANSMLCNLPAPLQHDKIRTLTDRITERCGVRPVAFRAGRWAYSLDVGSSLARLGYRVDSSVTPYFDWTSEQGPDFSNFTLEPCWPTLRDLFPAAPAEPLIELPVTIGFLQSDFARAASLRRRLLRQPFPRLKVSGLLYKLGLLNRVWLCPEHHTVSEMIALTEVLRKRRFPVLNLMFHSPTLQAGLTPFVRTESEERAFVARVRAYLDHAVDRGVEFVTLSEAAAALVERGAGATHSLA